MNSSSLVIQPKDQTIDFATQLKADKVKAYTTDMNKEVREINANAVQNNIKLKQELRRLKEVRKRQEGLLKKLKREKGRI